MPQSRSFEARVRRVIEGRTGSCRKCAPWTIRPRPAPPLLRSAPYKRESVKYTAKLWSTPVVVLRGGGATRFAGPEARGLAGMSRAFGSGQKLSSVASPARLIAHFRPARHHGDERLAWGGQNDLRREPRAQPGR